MNWEYALLPAYNHKNAPSPIFSNPSGRLIDDIFARQNAASPISFMVEGKTTFPVKFVQFAKTAPSNFSNPSGKTKGSVFRFSHCSNAEGPIYCSSEGMFTSSRFTTYANAASSILLIPFGNIIRLRCIRVMYPSSIFNCSECQKASSGMMPFLTSAFSIFITESFPLKEASHSVWKSTSSTVPLTTKESTL